MSTIYQIVLSSLLAAFIVLFTTKTELRYKIRDFCDIKGISLIAKMLDCDFCFSFWTNFAIAILFAIFFKDWHSLFIPLFSTPITRYLL